MVLRIILRGLFVRKYVVAPTLDSCDTSAQTLYTVLNNGTEAPRKFLSSSLSFSSKIYDKLTFRVRIHCTICSYILTIWDRHIFYQFYSIVSYPVTAVVDFFFLGSPRPARPCLVTLTCMLFWPDFTIADRAASLYFRNFTKRMIHQSQTPAVALVYYLYVRWHGCIRDWRSQADRFPGSDALFTLM